MEESGAARITSAVFSSAGEIHGCLLAVLQARAVESFLLLLLSFILQERRGSSFIHKGNATWRENLSVTCWFLSCQEDSEDGEMSRRTADELFLEEGPSTEDGELHIQHGARAAGLDV